MLCGTHPGFWTSIFIDTSILRRAYRPGREAFRFRGSACNRKNTQSRDGWWLLRRTQNLQTMLAETRISETNCCCTIGANPDGMRAVLKEFGCVEITVTREPCRRQVHAVRQQAKVGNEPCPVVSNTRCRQDRDQSAQNWTTPQGNQRMRIGLKEAVRQMPWIQISGFQ